METEASQVSPSSHKHHLHETFKELALKVLNIEQLNLSQATVNHSTQTLPCLLLILSGFSFTTNKT